MISAPQISSKAWSWPISAFPQTWKRFFVTICREKLAWLQSQRTLYIQGGKRDLWIFKLLQCTKWISWCQCCFIGLFYYRYFSLTRGFTIARHLLPGLTNWFVSCQAPLPIFSQKAKSFQLTPESLLTLLSFPMPTTAGGGGCQGAGSEWKWMSNVFSPWVSSQGVSAFPMLPLALESDCLCFDLCQTVSHWVKRYFPQLNG